MNARARLPAELGLGFWTTHARRLGVTKGRLGAADLVAPVRGTRAARESTAHDRLAAVLTGLPVAAFAMGRSAAQWYGVPLPALSEDPKPAEFHVGVPRGCRAPRRPGVHARSVKFEPDEIHAVRGTRMTSPSRTWLDLAAEMELADLVAAGDMLIRPPHELSSVSELETMVSRHPRARGARVARRALPLLSIYAESPQESRLRVILHLAGFPVTEVNPSIFDAAGDFVARVDLLFRDYRLVVEYEGEHHGSDPMQWKRDITRTGRLQSLGWLVERVHAEDLKAPAALLERIATHLSARGWHGSWRVP